MEENISIALKLMLIGMTTVSAILVLIVFSAKLLIRIVNKYPDPVVQYTSTHHENHEHIAAITGAVEFLTKGQGVISEIKKVKNG